MVFGDFENSQKSNEMAIQDGGHPTSYGVIRAYWGPKRKYFQTYYLPSKIFCYSTPYTHHLTHELQKVRSRYLSKKINIMREV